MVSYWFPLPSPLIRIIPAVAREGRTVDHVFGTDTVPAGIRTARHRFPSLSGLLVAGAEAVRAETNGLLKSALARNQTSKIRNTRTASRRRGGIPAADSKEHGGIARMRSG